MKCSGARASAGSRCPTAGGAAARRSQPTPARPSLTPSTRPAGDTRTAWSSNAATAAGSAGTTRTDSDRGQRRTTVIDSTHGKAEAARSMSPVAGCRTVPFPAAAVSAFTSSPRSGRSYPVTATPCTATSGPVAIQ